ncbi:hypothetical protein Anapl_11801 [Anas platyrhynchos]|uniref:Uncharacterized protein n=1 Tax=Anas platyrhynchos TaxID=8839 RepID=R0LML2_ANAPL|nr:hypothetical protein Anapl_11801 [Anas platyrhynchos]
MGIHARDLLQGLAGERRPEQVQTARGKRQQLQMAALGIRYICLHPHGSCCSIWQTGNWNFRTQPVGTGGLGPGLNTLSARLEHFNPSNYFPVRKLLILLGRAQKGSTVGRVHSSPTPFALANEQRQKAHGNAYISGSSAVTISIGFLHAPSIKLELTSALCMPKAEVHAGTPQKAGPGPVTDQHHHQYEQQSVAQPRVAPGKARRGGYFSTFLQPQEQEPECRAPSTARFISLL